MTSVAGLAEPALTPGMASTAVNNGNNQTAAWTHDANGNVTLDGTFSYIWDALNRLIQVKQSNTVVASYAYDSQNRRISKTVNGVTTHYLYDLNNQLIAETLADGTPIRDYFYLNGELLAVREYQSNPGLYYFVNDHLGTPQRLVSATGTVVWQAAYLPYGEALVQVSVITNNLRFPGQYFDAETGLHYNWNRYYAPKAGRYISADPIGLDGGLNLYAYVGGNPVNYTDPVGLVCFDFNKWADYISENRANDWWTLGSLSATLAIGELPKSREAGEWAMKAGGKGWSPTTTQLSRYEMRTGIKGLRAIGSGLAKTGIAGLATLLMFGEGVYDWGVIGVGAYKAFSLEDCECLQ